MNKFVKLFLESRLTEEVLIKNVKDLKKQKDDLDVRVNELKNRRTKKRKTLEEYIKQNHLTRIILSLLSLS